MVAYMAFSQSFAKFTELSYLPLCMLLVAPTSTQTHTSNLHMHLLAEIMRCSWACSGLSLRQFGHA